MQTVEISVANMAFEQGLVTDVAIVRRSQKEWYFEFTVINMSNETTQRYAIKTQRGELRTWADPRTLFNFLHDEYGVSSGRFVLNGTPNDEHSSTL